MQLIGEAISVGVVALVIGYIIFMILLYIGMGKDVTTVVLTLFSTGVLAHFLFEMAGANKWYCKHGKACQ